MIDQNQVEKILRILVYDLYALTDGSEIINTVSEYRPNFSEERVVIPDRDIRAFKSGKVFFEVDGEKFELQLESVLNSVRHDYIIHSSDEQLIGLIVIFDSSSPEIFSFIESIVTELEIMGMYPYIIAADKQDQSDAWDIDSLRIALRVPKEIPVIPCIATDKKSVANVLIALCEEILKDDE